MTSNDIRIKHIYNLELGQPALWERVILAFCTLHDTEGEFMGMRVWYKYFYNRLYIYRRENTNIPDLGHIGGSQWLN